jgi:hypothetical protein
MWMRRLRGPNVYPVVILSDTFITPECPAHSQKATGKNQHKDNRQAASDKSGRRLNHVDSNIEAGTSHPLLFFESK